MYNSGFASFNYHLTPWVKRLILANTVFFLVTMTGVIPLSWAVEFLGFNRDLTILLRGERIDGTHAFEIGPEALEACGRVNILAQFRTGRVACLIGSRIYFSS